MPLCTERVPLCVERVLLCARVLPPLASLVGLRSRTSAWGLSFFCSAIFPFFTWLFGFWLCLSRRRAAVRRPPSCLESGRPAGSASLSNASVVELHARRTRRPSFP